MPSERDHHHLLLLIEQMQRDGFDETEIARAVENARSEPREREPAARA